MRAAWLIAMVVAGCGTDDGSSLAHDMKTACDTHTCPADPPQYISCMPVVAPEWEPVCAQTCRDFLAMTCRIQFVD